MIVWKLWIDRNHCLHQTNQGIEQHDINNALIREYTIGIGDLPSQYAHLLQFNLETLLSKNIATKQRCLASIWSAKENHCDSQLYRNPAVQHNNFFLRWRIRADPDRAIIERRALQRRISGSRRTRVTKTCSIPSRTRSVLHDSSSSGSESELHQGEREN